MENKSINYNIFLSWIPNHSERAYISSLILVNIRISNYNQHFENASIKRILHLKVPIITSK